VTAWPVTSTTPGYSADSCAVLPPDTLYWVSTHRCAVLPRGTLRSMLTTAHCDCPLTCAQCLLGRPVRRVTERYKVHILRILSRKCILMICNSCPWPLMDKFVKIIFWYGSFHNSRDIGLRKKILSVQIRCRSKFRSDYSTTRRYSRCRPTFRKRLSVKILAVTYVQSCP